MSDVIFIILTVLLGYIYLGYPVLLAVAARVFARPHLPDERHEPTVTLIVSARNEELVIGQKLENALALDYPADKLAVLVVSDGSTDGTDTIVRGFAARGVRLLRPATRAGKTAGLNEALPLVDSEVVVFSDANAIYHRQAVRKLVRHFADPGVGYVVGHARYQGTGQTAAAGSEGAYWDLEVKMKRWESAFSSVVGGDGAIYAIRRELYQPMRETDINDFVNPLQIVARGFRGIFDPAAWCSEQPAGAFQREFSRKVRIANRSFNGLLRVPQALSPLRDARFAWQLVSHKLLRWFSPFVLLLHFGASLAAAGTSSLSDLLALASLAFYGLLAALALAGWRQDRHGEGNRLFSFPYYFVLMNVAAATGVLLRLKGQVISVWSTVREQGGGNCLPSRGVPLLLAGILGAALARTSFVLGVYLQLLGAPTGTVRLLPVPEYAIVLAAGPVQAGQPFRGAP